MLRIILLWLFACPSLAQTYHLRKEHDSLYYLNEWRLPYPVYQFQTGDVNGDGSTDALVGVIKATRYHPEKGRRLFIFKQAGGKVRPLWLASKLGGILYDFRMTGNRLRSMEKTTDGYYVVAEYQWAGFGMSFVRFLTKATDKQTATKYFNL